MTVAELCKQAGFKAEVLPDPDREISGVYIGDLLSWVMGRANSGDVWITIMSNNNILAVASLADTACILVAEDVALESELLKTAGEKGINVLLTDKSIYDAAVTISKLI